MTAAGQFGKYALVKRISQGGMGEIHVARQQGPGGFSKVVALKTVLPHLTENADFVRGFLNEAALSARMTHRNIVSVFDFGLDEATNSYYLAMEYVAGKALNQILEECGTRRTRIPVALVRDIVVQMCEGMSYAHNLVGDDGQPLNLVHRDLNPSNVLVSFNGDVKIIDWGIAKSELSQQKTEAGLIKGKFIYMSPEQSRAQRLDKRSDVFAAGITLYELLTRENPFHKANVVLTLEAIQRLEPPTPGELDPSLAAFDRIVMKALAKDREHRYADCADLAEELKQLQLPPAGERLGAFASRLFPRAVEDEQRLLQSRPSATITPSQPSVQAVQARRSLSEAAQPAMRAETPRPAVVSQERRDAGDQAATLMASIDELPGMAEMAQTLIRPAPPRSSSPPPRPPPPPPDASMVTRSAASREAVTKERSRERDGERGSQPSASGRVKSVAAPVPEAAPAPGSGRVGLVLGVVAGVLLGVLVIGAVLMLERRSAQGTAGDGAGTPEDASDTVAAPAAGEKVEPVPAVAAAVPAKEGPSESDAGAAQAEPPAEPEAAPAVAEAPAEAVSPVPAAAPIVSALRASMRGRPAPPVPKAAAKTVVSTAPVAVPSEPSDSDGPVAGYLVLSPKPALSMVVNGRSVEGSSFELDRDRGVIVLGDAGDPMRITLAYEIRGATLTARISSEPWSVVSVAGGQRGRVPQAVEVGAQLLRVTLESSQTEIKPVLALKFSPGG